MKRERNREQEGQHVFWISLGRQSAEKRKLLQRSGGASAPESPFISIKRPRTHFASSYCFHLPFSRKRVASFNFLSSSAPNCSSRYNIYFVLFLKNDDTQGQLITGASALRFSIAGQTHMGTLFNPCT